MGSTAQGMDGTVRGPSVDWHRHEGGGTLSLDKELVILDHTL